MKIIEFRVEGMHCKSCEMLINDALEDLGVKKSKADKDNGTVRVHFNEDEISKMKIRQVIQDEGYKVFVEKTVE